MLVWYIHRCYHICRFCCNKTLNTSIASACTHTQHSTVLLLVCIIFSLPFIFSHFLSLPLSHVDLHFHHCCCFFCYLFLCRNHCSFHRVNHPSLSLSLALYKYVYILITKKVRMVQSTWITHCMQTLDRIHLLQFSFL